MKWRRAVMAELAYVTCPLCGKWSITRPSTEGDVEDSCRCGHQFIGRLNDWSYSSPRKVTTHTEWSPTAPGNEGDSSRT